MKSIIWIVFAIFTSLPAQEKLINSKISVQAYNLNYYHSDSAIFQINDYVESGLNKVTAFFDKKFKKTVDIYVYPNRKSLDKQWQTAWGMPDFVSQCWMVGSGIQSRLDLLSPSVWETEACEHDRDDNEEIERLIVHELVHVLHSDFNISPDFSEINNIDWFVEGLATYASGQLDAERLIPLIQYVKSTGGPSQLSQFWKGEHKYGLSGSLVYYIDKAFGRKLLSSLIIYNDLNDILSKLNLTEQELITKWKENLLGVE